MLEDRRVLTANFYNGAMPADVNHDGYVSALDANAIATLLGNRDTSFSIAALATNTTGYDYNVNNDSVIDAADFDAACSTINQQYGSLYGVNQLYPAQSNTGYGSGNAGTSSSGSSNNGGGYSSGSNSGSGGGTGTASSSGSGAGASAGSGSGNAGTTTSGNSNTGSGSGNGNGSGSSYVSTSGNTNAPLYTNPIPQWNPSPSGQYGNAADNSQFSWTDATSVKYWALDTINLEVGAQKGVLRYLREAPQSLPGVAPGQPAGQAALSATMFRNASHGVVSLASNGAFTYDATDGYIGTDYFFFDVTCNSTLLTTHYRATIDVEVAVIQINLPPSDGSPLGLLSGPNWVPVDPSIPIDVYAGQSIDLRVITTNDPQRKLEGWGQLSDVNDVEYIHWTIASSAIKNWEATPQIGRVIKLTDQDVKSQYLSYYYVASGLKLPTVSAELFSPTTSDEGSRSPLGTINLQVKLNVSKPSNSFTGIQGPISIDPQNGGRLSHSGISAAGTPIQGVKYAISDSNQVMDGRFQFVQTLNSFVSTRRATTDVDSGLGDAGTTVEKQYDLTLINGERPAAIDSDNGTGYAYDFSDYTDLKLVGMHDSPSVPLVHQQELKGSDSTNGVMCHVNYISVQQSFSTYLMWRVDLRGSIYVPISIANWSWAAAAVWDDASNSWSVMNGSTSVMDTTSQLTTSHPEWIESASNRVNFKNSLSVVN